MNTSSLKNSDEEMSKALYEASRRVMPSEDLLRTTLMKIPTESPRIFKPVPSPLTGTIFSYLKIGVPVLVVMVLVAGGTTIAAHTLTPSAQPVTLTMSSPTDTSDAAISQDSAVIDSELSSLDTSISSTDQALDYTPQP
jgi:hypothetical protein